MNVLIIGCGRVGAHLAELLDAEGHKVTVLDIDSYSFRRLPPSFKGTVLLGSGADEDSLVKAGIKKVDVFVAVTDGDNRNIMAAQIAREIFKVSRVICRINDHLRQEVYESLGLETISPTTILAQMLKEKVVG